MNVEAQLNIKTPYGTLVGSETYGSQGYGEWIQNIADKLVEAHILDDAFPYNNRFEDYISFLEGEVERTDNPLDKEKLSDLIVAIKMILAGEKFENSPTVTPSGYYGSWIHAIFYAREKQFQKKKPIFIRVSDYDLYIKVRSQAIREGKNVVEWINEAMEFRLAKA